MIPARCFLSVLLAAATSPASAGEKSVVPSDPASWNRDFLRVTQPTQDCAGGTIEQLGNRTILSQPYSPLEFEAFHRGALSMRGLADSDRFYSFYARSEFPGGDFLAFGGYVVVRATCIIHAEVTTYDN
jgi:hypothetical protein